MARQNTNSVAPPLMGRAQAVASPAFEWAFVALCGWQAGGAYLDGWAHVHLDQLESFFTPWHAVLYAGFLAVTLFLVGALIRGRRQGLPWRQALPDGYTLSLVGALIFAAGGLVDMVWHTLFGIEADVDALLSPSHLLLALGAGLIVTGPLRSAWRRSKAARSADGWVQQLPAVISLALLLSVFTFFTQYAHPWASPFAASHYRTTDESLAFHRQALGVAGILLQAGTFTALILLVLKQLRLPMGSLTLIFVLNAILMGLMRDQHQVIPAAAVAGVAADALLRVLDPTCEPSIELRVFAFAVPALLYGFYFLALQLTGGVWWSVHLWTGSIALAGTVGWLLSYLVAPPRAPRSE